MKIREYHSRTRKPRKTNFGKNGDRVPPNKCYGAAFGVLRPASSYKYEKILDLKLIEITS